MSIRDTPHLTIRRRDIPRAEIGTQHLFIAIKVISAEKCSECKAKFKVMYVHCKIETGIKKGVVVGIDADCDDIATLPVPPGEPPKGEWPKT